MAVTVRDLIQTLEKVAEGHGDGVEVLFKHYNVYQDSWEYLEGVGLDVQKVTEGNRRWFDDVKPGTKLIVDEPNA